MICVSLGICGGDQAVAMAMPAALLVTGGLVAAAIPDPATGRRLGFKAGSRAGSMLSRWRSMLRGPRDRPLELSSKLNPAELRTPAPPHRVCAGGTDRGTARLPWQWSTAQATPLAP
jgi:hypothetical protein